MRIRDDDSPGDGAPPFGPRTGQALPGRALSGPGNAAVARLTVLVLAAAPELTAPPSLVARLQSH
jgi:hypothetical protein